MSSTINQWLKNSNKALWSVFIFFGGISIAIGFQNCGEFKAVTTETLSLDSNSLSFQEKGYIQIDDMVVHRSQVSLNDLQSHWPDQFFAQNEAIQNREAASGLSTQSRSSSWSGGMIPVSFADSVPPNVRSQFMSVCGELSVFSGVYCVPWLGQQDSVEVVYQSSDFCGLSFVGRQSGKQNLSLNPACSSQLALVIKRQLLHTLGFQNPINRMDRDQSVNINLANARSDAAPHFVKFAMGSTPLPNYDYDSILHPASNHHSRNGSMVITKPNGDAITGSSTLSAQDRQALTQLYPLVTMPRLTIAVEDAIVDGNTTTSYTIANTIRGECNIVGGQITVEGYPETGTCDGQFYDMTLNFPNPGLYDLRATMMATGRGFSEPAILSFSRLSPREVIRGYYITHQGEESSPEDLTFYTNEVEQGLKTLAEVEAIIIEESEVPDTVEDTTAPNISIASPDSGSNFESSITVSGNCNDDTATVSFSPGNNDTTNCTGTSFSHTLDYSNQDEGPITIIATITDPAGNSNVATLTVNKVEPTNTGGGGGGGGDPIPDDPILQITQPQEGQHLGEAQSVVISGNCNRDTTIAITPGSHNVPCDGTHFQTTVDYSETAGSSFTITAQMGTFSSGSVSVMHSVTVTKEDNSGDNSGGGIALAPDLAFTSPASEAEIFDNDIVISGTCNLVGATVTLSTNVAGSDSSTTICDGANFQAIRNYSNRNDGSFNIIAEMGTIQKAVATLNVMKATENTTGGGGGGGSDDPRPVLAFTSPAEGAEVFDNDIVISGTCNLVGATVTLSTNVAGSDSSTTICDGANFQAIRNYSNRNDGSFNIIAEMGTIQKAIATLNVMKATENTTGGGGDATLSCESNSLATLNGIYQTYFNRDIAAEGIGHWCPILESGTRTVPAITVDILLGARDDEYFQDLTNLRNDRSEDGRRSQAISFLAENSSALPNHLLHASEISIIPLYQDWFGRLPDGEGLIHWGNQKEISNSSSQTFSCRIIAVAQNSPFPDRDAVNNHEPDARTFCEGSGITMPSWVTGTSAPAPLLAFTAPASGAEVFDNDIVISGTCNLVGATVTLSTNVVGSDSSTTTCDGANFQATRNYSNRNDGSFNIIAEMGTTQKAIATLNVTKATGGTNTTTSCQASSIAALNEIYQEYFGRDIDDSGRDHWCPIYESPLVSTPILTSEIILQATDTIEFQDLTNLLNDQSLDGRKAKAIDFVVDTRNMVPENILTESEKSIVPIYQTWFGRLPDGAGLISWGKNKAAGNASDRAFTCGLVTAATNTPFTDQTYINENKEPALRDYCKDTGVALPSWLVDSTAPTCSPNSIATLNGIYQTYFGRDIADEGRDHWCPGLEDGSKTVTQLTVDIIHGTSDSANYQDLTNLKNDRTYDGTGKRELAINFLVENHSNIPNKLLHPSEISVIPLYQHWFGRLPDGAGLIYWGKNKEDGGASDQVFTCGFLRVASNTPFPDQDSVNTKADELRSYCQGSGVPLPTWLNP